MPAPPWPSGAEGEERRNHIFLKLRRDCRILLITYVYRVDHETTSCQSPNSQKVTLT